MTDTPVTIDPLADLRDAWGPSDSPVLAPEPAKVERVALLETQEEQDALRSEIIVAWHADSTAQGFLHSGGHCGCRYIASLAVGIAAPVQAIRP